jgi:hypothetical protein
MNHRSLPDFQANDRPIDLMPLAYCSHGGTLDEC